MRGIWERYRGLSTIWQVVIGGFLGLMVIGAAAGSGEEEPVRVEIASDSAEHRDVADQLPYAATSTTSELSTTTMAPTTTEPTTTVPPTTAPTTTAPPPPSTTAPPTTVAFVSQPSSDDCHPSYDPCVPIASDVDCAGGSGNGPAYTGFVRVIGYDEYDLDRDGDGLGCE